jgi:uncharacterized phiE125 gp8 family phage protein
MIQIVTPPAVELVDGTDVQTFLRLDSDDYNDRLQQFATSARIMAENYTRRAFITQTWQLMLDYKDVFKNYDYIVLPRPPLQSIANITTYNDVGTSIAQNDTSYFADTFSEPGRAVLKTGYTWNYTRMRTGMVVEYVCGYGDTADKVPQDIQDAIMEAAAYFFTQGTTGVLPPDVITKLQPYRIYL